MKPTASLRGTSLTQVISVTLGFSLPPPPKKKKSWKRSQKEVDKNRLTNKHTKGGNHAKVAETEGLAAPQGAEEEVQNEVNPRRGGVLNNERD